MDAMTLDREYIAGCYGRFPVTFVKGEGAALWDDMGREYIDMGSGIAVSALGHGDKSWLKATTKQLRRLCHASNLYYTKPQAKLARLLCEKTGMKKVFFCNSGAEANECAIKVARKYAADKFGDEQRPVIVTLKNSFHGRTLATLAATGQDVFHHSFGPFPDGFVYCEANNAQELEQLLRDNPCCAVLLEPVQGEGGVVPLTKEFMLAARRLTEEHDCLLMLDEVQTGNGRTGQLYAYMHYGIQPDVVSTAKGLAGGLPMGACLLGEKVQDTLTPGSHGTTFGGNPVCAAGALCVIKRLDDELMAEVRQKSDYIFSELSGCKNVKSITGLGLMIGIETTKDARALVEGLLGRGVVTLTAKTKLRLLPPLTIPMEQLQRAVRIIKEEIEA